MTKTDPLHDLDRERVENLRDLSRAALMPRLIAVVLAAWMTVVTAGFTLMFLELWPLVQDTNKNAESTSDAIMETIGQRDETISDQKIVIDQAVIYITDMAHQIIELGGTPPEVILDPNKDEPEEPQP